MEYIKKLGISLGITIGSILILTLLITILNYFNLFSEGLVNVFKIIIPIISLFVGGFLMGKSSNEKGWIEGLKFSLIFIILLILFNLMGLGSSLEFKNLLYYVIIIISSIFGGILGINKNSTE